MLPEIYQNNPIVRHSFEFALLIDSYCAELNKSHKYDLSRQLFRSGTSIGANVWESQEAESKSDFIHKMKIAAKEARETYFWLLVCQNAPNYPPTEDLLNKLAEIRRLLSAILFSSKRKFIPDFILSFFFLI